MDREEYIGDYIEAGTGRTCKVYKQNKERNGGYTVILGIDYKIQPTGRRGYYVSVRTFQRHYREAA